MKISKMLVFVITLASYATGASARTSEVESTSQVIKHHAPKGITAAFYRCIDESNDDTFAASACLTDEQTRQDKRLNATYKALLGMLKPEEKKS